MNTLESAFDKWRKEDGKFAMDIQAAFNAGYVAGFDHAKKEDLSTLATALDPRPRHD